MVGELLKQPLYFLYLLVRAQDFVSDSLYSGVEEMNRVASLEYFLHGMS